MDPTKLEGMIQQAQQMAQKLQQEMGQRKADGHAGGGMVTATVNGEGTLLSLKIDPKVVDKNDIPMLEDLIVAAVNDAHTRIREQLSAEMQKLTGGMPFPSF